MKYIDNMNFLMHILLYKSRYVKCIYFSKQIEILITKKNIIFKKIEKKYKKIYAKISKK